ncbi:MAG: MFS transporter [Caulobacteraceae bacterium]
MAKAGAQAEGVDEKKRLPAGQVVAVAVGNALQFYDFLTYAFFASQIGLAFFPSRDPSASLLASLATFGAGFLTRPVGAVVIGRIADRIGRKPAMILSFSLMGASIVGLALTPPFAMIGLAAPALAIGFRLLQGFALGGEVGPSTAFLIEASPPSRRGFYVSLQSMTQDGAVLVAGLVGFGLSSVMTEGALEAWGWRAAFLLGAVIVPFGLLLRSRLAETLHEGAAVESDARGDRFLAYARIAIVGFVLLGSGTIVSYVLTYLTTYAETTLKMATSVAFTATIVQGLVGVLFDAPGGWLSDRFGRRSVMIIPWALLLCATLPCFWAISHFRTESALIWATALLTVFSSISGSSVLVAITESLPRSVRAGALGTIYALAISALGGSTQFIIADLIRVTRSPLAPAWYMAAAVAVGIAAMFFIGETAPARPAKKRTDTVRPTPPPLRRSPSQS